MTDSFTQLCVPGFSMKQVKWDLSIGSMVEVDAEHLNSDCVESQLMSLTLHQNDLIVALVRYRLLPVKESLQWTRILNNSMPSKDNAPWHPPF